MAQASIKLSDSAAINGCVPLWKDRSNDASAGPSTCRPSPPVSWNSLSSATIASNYRKCEKSRNNCWADAGAHLLAADGRLRAPRKHPVRRDID